MVCGAPAIQAPQQAPQQAPPSPVAQPQNDAANPPALPRHIKRSLRMLGRPGTWEPSPGSQAEDVMNNFVNLLRQGGWNNDQIAHKYGRGRYDGDHFAQFG